MAPILKATPPSNIPRHFRYEIELPRGAWDNHKGATPKESPVALDEDRSDGFRV